LIEKLIVHGILAISILQPDTFKRLKTKRSEPDLTPFFVAAKIL
jgi:hypothetical protein